jgi:hypothetical protein
MSTSRRDAMSIRLLALVRLLAGRTVLLASGLSSAIRGAHQPSSEPG